MPDKNQRAFEAQFRDPKVKEAARHAIAAIESFNLNRIQGIMVVGLLYKGIEKQAPSPELKAKVREVFEATVLVTGD